MPGSHCTGSASHNRDDFGWNLDEVAAAGEGYPHQPRRITFANTRYRILVNTD